MKNHIAVKFIAVFLCALTLMGAAGSALGIFVMTELDLYARTVDQLKAERMVSGAEHFAQSTAMRYASETLGGCPEEFLDEYYGDFLDVYYTEGQYAYRILDAEGKELYSYGEIREEEATSYTFPVTGRYLHLVSHETPEQRENRLMATAASYSANFTIGDDARIMDALPPGGRHVSYVSMVDADGNVLYDLFDNGGVGFLYYDKAGRVTFSGSRFVEDPNLMGMTVAGVYFQSLDGTVLYEATASAGVGVLSFSNDGRLMFTAGIDESVTVAPVEKTDLQTAEGAVTSAPAGIFPIFYVAFLNDADEAVYEAFSEQSVGFLTTNEAGQAVYRGYLPEAETLPEDVCITDAYFYSYNEGLLYHASNAEGIGTVEYSRDGQMIFVSSDPEPVFDLDALAKKEKKETQEAEETEATEETEDAEADEETDATEAEETTEATEETREEKEPSSASGIPDVTMATEPAVEAEADTGLINGKPLEEYQIDTYEYYNHYQQDHIFVSYVRPTLPEYTVELRLTANALGMAGEYQLLELLKNFSGYLFPVLGACLLLFAVCAVYLCCAAGRKPGTDEVKANGLNAIPLDLYTLVGGFLAALACVVGADLGIDRLNQNLLFSSIIVGAAAFAVCLLVVAFCFAIAAQVKTPGGYWWRNTLTMRFMMLFFKFAAWFEKFLGRKCFPWLGRLVKWLWKVGVLGAFRLWERFAHWFLKTFKRLCRWTFDRLGRFFSLIPLTWQWLLGGLVLLFLGFANDSISDTAGMLAFLLGLAIILYAAHCFGILSDSTKRMGKGDLDVKVEDKLLLGCFKDFADDLNDLADVAVVAAQKQLKSERMKTELITNVSHDIKTPLTSIINYVDLLQKPHSEQEQEQYLEVLDRQSLRLKKLIDDLMEMSKASTGNMAVEITTVDAVESVNQALGEFSDKLAAARLTPMFRHAENRVSMRADGKLVWRVLSNILSNAVKYAMPGTRLYIDLMELEGKVVISLKNISREELNVDADELMERFVRGDDSRNTEGSGLGLNIAKSLMELQKGQLQLLVDGDLFKVTLIFPGIS